MRLLIAYDGSECARAAIDDLTHAGLPERCEALVLAALDVWLPARGERTERELPGLAAHRARVEERLSALRTEAEAGAVRLRAVFPSWTIRCDAVADSPAWVIIKRAEGDEGGVMGGRADLVVVGSHGHGGFKRFMLGSVSQKVVTQVRCSTRIARMRPDGTHAADPTRPVRVVVGMDGSADAEAAVTAIAQRRWPAGSEAIVVTADESAVTIDPAAGMASMVLDPGWAASVAESGVKSLRASGLNVRAWSGVGFARHLLVDRAEAEKADCVFIGARGARAVERFLLGSVSTWVAMNAPCSVEIVHRS